jgi:hypothetical protein
MAGISKQACINLILQYIGGNPLDQISSTVVAGAPVAIQRGMAQITSLTSLASSFSGLESLAGDLLGDIAGDLVGDLAGDLAGSLAGDLAGIAEQLATGDIAGALSSIAQNPLSGELGSLTSEIASLADGGFSGFDSLLPDVVSDPLLSDSVNLLKEAVAGSDGRGGAALIAAIATEHTDRISGILLTNEDESSSAFEVGA